MKYKGVKTTSESNGKRQIYYEKAFDKNGKGLVIGDKVKIVSASNKPVESMGKVEKVVGIFEGDLMLGEPYFYCYPINVELVAPSK